MRILHLMMNEKFTKSISRFYDLYFNDGQHEIGYVHAQSDGSIIDPSLTIRQYDFFCEGANPVVCAHRFKKLLKEYDYIVLHSFFVLGRFSSLLYLLTAKEMKKLVWIEWGADLYDNCTGLKKRLRDRVKSSVRAFIAIFPPDQAVYRKMFPDSKAGIYYERYMGPPKIIDVSKEIWETPRLKLTRVSGEPVYVMIGHNGQEQLRHIEVLKRLEKFKDENIRVVLSLSYGGSPEYVEKVSETAVSIFGNKAIILKDFMSREAYFKLTERIDIAVFHTQRQTGLSNIYSFMMHKVKLYFCPDGVLYEYFHERGLPIQNIDLIGGQNFDAFCELADNCDTPSLKTFFEDLYDNEKHLENWRSIYRELDDMTKSR